jgi:hypothetical protein
MASTIALEWTVPADGGAPILGYRLYRCDGAGTPTDLIVDTGETAHEDADIDQTALGETGYSYAVTAYNAVGEGPTSNRVFLRGPVPSAPVLSGEITHDVDWVLTGALAWTEPDGQGWPILGYRLYRREGNGTTAPSVVLVTTANRTYADAETRDEAEVEGVEVGGYTYAVAAYTAVGESPLSNLVWLGVAPAHPPTLEVTVDHDPFWMGLVTVTTGAAAFRGGEPVAQYRLYRQLVPNEPDYLIRTTASPETWQEETNPTTPTSTYEQVWELLLRDPGYTYKVVATSLTGDAQASSVVSAQHAIVAPTVPTPTDPALELFETFPTGYLVLTWEAVSTGGPPPTYLVEHRANGGAWISAGYQGNVLTWTLAGLIMNGSTIDFRLKALTVWGESEYSAPVSYTLPTT